MPEGTATVIYLRSLVQLLALFGTDAKTFLDEIGVHPALLEETDARLPKSVVARAWTVASRLAGVSNIGLKAAALAPPGAFQILDHVAAHQPDVEHVARAMVRFYRLCDPELCMQFAVAPDGASISCVFSGSAAEYSRDWAEAVIALCLVRVRALAQRPDISPLRVQFQHSAPARLDEHEQFFRCPVEFGAALTGMTCSLDVLSVPIPGADAFLSRVLLEYAEGQLQHLPATDDTKAFTRRALMRLAGGQAPDLGGVAREAHCSSRALQARLRAEGTSFSRILDEVRKDLAIRYVGNQALRIAEIPLLLDYSEASPFYRAFKRWTGRTPEEYRQSEGARVKVVSV